MKIAFKRSTIAASTVACLALMSFSWSEQRGISLGVESAQARNDRPSASRSVAGIARRQYRRSGAELLATAVASTTTPWHYDDYYCYGVPYAGGSSGGYYYSGYPGGYCVSSSDLSGLDARRTLFPRYYGLGR